VLPTPCCPCCASPVLCVACVVCYLPVLCCSHVVCCTVLSSRGVLGCVVGVCHCGVSLHHASRCVSHQVWLSSCSVAVCCLWGVVALCIVLRKLPGVLSLCSVAVCHCRVSLWGVVVLCVTLCELLGVVVLVRCCGVLLQGVIAPCIMLHELLGVSSSCGVSHGVSLQSVVLMQCVAWLLSLWCCVSLSLHHVIVAPCVVVIVPCAIVLSHRVLWSCCVIVPLWHHVVIVALCVLVVAVPCHCHVMLCHCIVCCVIVLLSHHHWCWGVTMRWGGLELVCTQSLKCE